MKSSITEKLTNLGFSKYESQAYYYLLTKGAMSASEIVKLSEVPQGRIYSVLQMLEDKGLVTMFPGAIKKFKATDPKTAFSVIIDLKKKEVEQANDLKKGLEQLYVNNTDNLQPSDYIQILTSKSSQVSKFDEIINASTQTLYSLNKKPYATGFLRNKQEIIKASKPLEKILRKGVCVRAIFEEEYEHVNAFIEMLEYYKSIGEQVRIGKSLPLKMLLSDGILAMVSLKNNDSSRFKLTSMVIEHTDLTKALMELFNKYWQESIDLETYKTRLMEKANNHDK